MKASKVPQAAQKLEKTNVPCLYRSTASGIYYGIFTRGRRQVKKSLKTPDKELARRLLEQLRQKVARLNTKEGQEISFPELAKRWLEAVGGHMKPKSRVRRQTAINTLKEYFPNTARSITKTQVEQWAASRIKVRAARTFNIERETLIQILDYAAREGVILENTARAVKRAKQGKPALDIPTKAQFKALVAQLRGADVRATEAANLVEFLAYSGCRLGEATAMCWEDVDFPGERFTVTGGEEGTKNTEARMVPLSPPLKRHLQKMNGEIRQTFGNAPGSKDRLFRISSAKRAISTACEKAKLPHFSHHSLRHFFASNAIEAGIDFNVIAGWLGHKDGGVLVAKTYGHLRDEHSTAMAKRMTFDAAGA